MYRQNQPRVAGPAVLDRLVDGGEGTLHYIEKQYAQDIESCGAVFLI